MRRVIFTGDICSPFAHRILQSCCRVSVSAHLFLAGCACAHDGSVTIGHIVLNPYMAVGVVVQLKRLVTEGGFRGTSTL